MPVGDAQLPRPDQAGEGLEGRIVRFHAQACEPAARRLGARGEIGIAAAHDRDQQATGSQHADGAEGGVTADGVEHHIHAIDMRGEVGSAVVDELVGAQARDEVMLATLAVPMTWAPRALAIWTARCPTPPPDPWISTRWPAAT